ncbi:hypothetical protein TIFTF001_055430 [Ficus carica]|uniref:Uncharacterized protein n=1 Tax=Ficus carica TaxID=3494 RepID=A0AA88EI53_FICCA|nr:hypothetical protein TIFTF001_055430 [Ficus carica]
MDLPAMPSQSAVLYFDGSTRLSYEAFGVPIGEHCKHCWSLDDMTICQ